MSGEKRDRKDANLAGKWGAGGRTTVRPALAHLASRALASLREPHPSPRRGVPFSVFRGRGRFVASRLHAPFSGARQRPLLPSKDFGEEVAEAEGGGRGTRIKLFIAKLSQNTIGYQGC